MKELRTSPNGREQRMSQSAVVLQSRAAEENPVIEGHGALFNAETIIGGWFREVIAPGAFKDSIATDDIRVAFNHDANFILGRTSAKTATVQEDGKGLKYTATPPDTTAGRDTVTSIKRGDITGSSFQFTIENDDDEDWDFEQTKKGMLPLRTIKRAKLWEVGPVAWPAYETTTVSARAQAKVEEARALADAAKAAAPLTETPATPVVGSTRRTAEDIQRDIQRDLGLLLELAQAAPTRSAEPTSVPATEPAPHAAAAPVAAPAARVAEAPMVSSSDEFSIDRELELLAREVA
jgi:HK97 family phage prohead protease